MSGKDLLYEAILIFSFGRSSSMEECIDSVAKQNKVEERKVINAKLINEKFEFNYWLN